MKSILFKTLRGMRRSVVTKTSSNCMIENRNYDIVRQAHMLIIPNIMWDMRFDTNPKDNTFVFRCFLLYVIYIYFYWTKSLG